MGESSLKVTGSIVTYNNQDEILPCIESILKYTKKYQIHLYIFDNGSTDQTLELISSHFSGITILKNKMNLGFGKGHNQVLLQIDSDYHFIINPDIYIKEDVVAELVDFLKLHPHAAIVTPQILNPDGSVQHLPKREPSVRYVLLSKLPFLHNFRKEYTREIEKIEVPIEIEFCTGCFFAGHTEKLREAGGFDERYFMYFEDIDLSRKIRRRYEIFYNPQIFVYHRWARGNVKTWRGIKYFVTSMIQYFNCWGWKF